MAKIKNRILIILALVMLCAVGLFALSACSGSETYTVTFMVRENGTTGDWQQYTTVDTNDDGSVTLPAEPTVDGYTFRDWYTDEACNADNVFDESNVTGDITVYALMAEANVTLNVTDGSGTATQVAGTLSALSQTTTEQEAAAAEENLTFDGWYTDAAFTQKYSNGMDVTTLYGRYMAAVTIDDGYDTVYTALVTPGTAMSEPADNDVLQYYMGEIVYYTLVDSDGNIIKYISGVNGDSYSTTAVEEIVLPDTLKIIDMAFNNLSLVSEINLPEGIEVIINSLWGTYRYSDEAEAITIGNYSFDINIPESVINISRAPSNFVYSENSDFWYDEVTKATYKKGSNNNYETLISMYDFGSAANVREGVEYIQVGAFAGMDFDYLYLPSTFKNASYNVSADEYLYYIGAINEEGVTGTNESRAFNLYASDGSTTRYGVAFVDTLHLLERVVIDQAAKPSELSVDAIQGWVRYVTWNNYTALVFDDEDKVVFTGEITSGETVTVRVRAIYEINGEYNTYSVSGIMSGGVLTEQAILDAIGFDSTASVVVSITQFGDDYFASDSEAESGKTVNCRQYIEVVYSDNPGGAIIELVDGVMTVTGFDVETAQGDANTGYIVSIPATYNGVAVTAIAEGAFKGNGSIVTVSIPSSVTVIGAEAFMDTVNLTTVTIAPGGLSVVGRSAFENSGFTSIALPLANLTEVGAYAFKSEKLIYFTAAEGETPLLLTNFIVTEMVEDTSNYVSSIIKTLIGVEAYVDIDTIDTGTFGYIKDSYGHYIAIFQYMGVDTAEKAAGAETEEVTVYDVRLIAVAGGAYAEQGSTSSSYAISFGLSWRDNYYSNALYTPYLKNAVVRFEIMEGSVYYLDGTSSIVLGVVSKVHENAFTDINESSAVVIYTKTEDAYDDTWLTKDDLNDGTIFENGWWQGMDMSSDEYEKFVNNITEYTRSLH